MLHQRVQLVQSALDTALCDRIWTVQQRILANRLVANLRLHGIHQIVSNLIRRAERFSQETPRRSIRPGSDRSGSRSRHKQGARLCLVVDLKGCSRLAFPCLTCSNPGGSANPPGDCLDQWREPARFSGAGDSQTFEGHHDQRIPRKQGKRFTMNRVNRRLTATEAGVIEAWQIVVNQGRAMQQFDGGCSCIRDIGTIVAAGARDSQAQHWTHASPARENRVAKRLDSLPDLSIGAAPTYVLQIGHKLASSQLTSRNP